MASPQGKHWWWILCWHRKFLFLFPVGIFLPPFSSLKEHVKTNMVDELLWKHLVRPSERNYTPTTICFCMFQYNMVADLCHPSLTEWGCFEVLSRMRDISSFLGYVFFFSTFAKPLGEVSEWLALSHLDPIVPGSNPVGGGIQLRTKRWFINRAFHYQPSIVSIWLK